MADRHLNVEEIKRNESTSHTTPRKKRGFFDSLVEGLTPLDPGLLPEPSTGKIEIPLSPIQTKRVP